MHTQICGSKGYMALKLDLNKAYDKVKWNFVQVTMLKLGFASQ